MSTMPFPADEKQRIVGTIQRHLAEELGYEIGRFDAEFLFDLVVREAGAPLYNQALRDAQAVLAARIDDVQDAILQLERPTTARR